MRKNLIVVFVIAFSIVITLNWLKETPSGCYQKAFAVGSTVCHQLPNHSYHHGEIQFPLCARCSGLYLGSLFALVYYLTQGKRRGVPAKGYLVFLAVLFLGWAGDGFNSFISDILDRPFLYETTNTVRIITGFGMGIVMSTALITLFNMVIWKDGSNQPLLRSPWQMVGYAILCSIMGIVLPKSGDILFIFFAYLSIVAVLITITMLYTVFWVIIMRKEMQFTTLSSLWLYLIWGFGTAMVQTTLLTMLRNWLFG